MKKISIIALGFVAVLAALFGLQQMRQRAAEQARLAETERALAATVGQADRERIQGERERARLQDANAALADKVHATSPGAVLPSTNAPAGSGGDTERFQEVHKDPEMKEAMRRQGQKSVERMVRQLVTTNLIQSLGLNESQTAALQEMLARRGTLGFEFMMPLMSGELDEASLAEAGGRIKGAIAEVEAQVKGLLGEEGSRVFEAYERAQPDRERTDQFAASLQEAGQPMTAGQHQALLAAMSEERSRFTFTTDYGDTSKIDFEHFKDFYAENRMNLYFDEMSRLNERMVQRAQAILSPAQAGRFQDLLRDQTLKSKYVIKTTNALIGKQAAR